MGELHEIWTEVEDAVGEALNNGEGRASAWYLEHHFNKAGLGIYRLPDSQLDRAWASVNVLGAPDSACTTDYERGYSKAIGDALAEIEKLGGKS